MIATTSDINGHEIDAGLGTVRFEEEVDGIIDPLGTDIDTGDHHTTTDHTGRGLTSQNLGIEPRFQDLKKIKKILPKSTLRSFEVIRINL